MNRQTPMKTLPSSASGTNTGSDVINDFHAVCVGVMFTEHVANVSVNALD